MSVTVVKLVDADGNPAVVTAGNDFAVTITLTKDGQTYDVTGGTVTCTIRDANGVAKITDHAISLTTPASGIVTLSLTDTETALLKQPTLQEPTKTELHYGDVKVVEAGGAITHCGPFSFPVRRAHT